MTVNNNVSTNIGAENARRYMDINSSKQAKANAQLASGSLTSDSSENATGSAIGSSFATTIVAEMQASLNVTQASAMIQMASGSLDLVVDLLTTMKARTTQANTDTVDDTARAMLDREFQLLMQQIDTAADTRWGDVSLFSGSASSINRFAAKAESIPTLGESTVIDNSSIVLAGFVAGSVEDVVVESAGSNSATVTVSVGNQQFQGTIVYGASDQIVLNSLADGGSSNIRLSLQTDQTFSSVDGINTDFRILMGLDVAAPVALRSTSTDLSSTLVTVTAGTATQGGNYALSYGYDSKSGDVIYKLTDGMTEFKQNYTAEASASRTVVFENGLSVAVSNIDEKNPVAGYELLQIESGAHRIMQVQIGADIDNVISIDFRALTTDLLGFSGANVLTKQAAEAASHIIDSALTQINSMKADLGGKKSQLNFQSQNLSLRIQNEAAAKATFTDADIAKSLEESMQAQALSQMASNVFANLLQAPDKLASLVQQSLR